MATTTATSAGRTKAPSKRSARTSRVRGNPSRDALIERASANTLALNPLVGIRRKDVLAAATTLAGRLASRPKVVSGAYAKLLGDYVLDHLGFDEADVLGVSWGGAIAQQFALQHPSRCRRLVLAATAPGVLMVPGHPSVLLKMLTPRRYVDKRHAQRIAGDVYGGAFRREPELVERTLRHVRFSSRSGYYMQLGAALGWSSLPWLPALRQPTLIMAGDDDPLIPTINARIMRCLIPDARLEVLPCGHLFLVTLAERSARIVDAFLGEPAARRRARHTFTPAEPLRRNP